LIQGCWNPLRGLELEPVCPRYTSVVESWNLVHSGLYK
jgi:hypothetical protein